MSDPSYPAPRSQQSPADSAADHTDHGADDQAGMPAWSRRGFMVSLAAMTLQACQDDENVEATTSIGDTSRATGDGSGSNAVTINESPASTGISAKFVHPGLLHTQADLDRMKAKVAAGASPWIDGWNVLVGSGTSSTSWVPIPQAVVYRGSDGIHAQNYALLFRDIAAAYANALHYRISGDTAHADAAVRIMNAWSSTLTGFGGNSDLCLAGGIYGYEFANAAELLRDYSGWSAPDFAQFQQMMRNVFYPVNAWFLETHSGRANTHYWANWDICNMASMLAIGVLCDDREMFDRAVTYFKEGIGCGSIMQAVYYVHDGYLGQWQESGRDQGHNTLGIALMGAFCEMAWNQGLDLYGYENNRFLAGAEYVAKANLIESGTSFYTVPFVRYNNVNHVNQTAFSPAGQGMPRPCWALIYNHYVKRKGLAAPYSRKFMELVAPEGGGAGANSGGYDQLGYGTLTCTRDALVIGISPSGLTARTSAGSVTLSWWGVAEGLSYNVKRAASGSGHFTTIAAGISDLLTYTDASVPAGTYQYVVTATTASGETAASAPVTVVTAKQLHTHLLLDETNGKRAADASGNGRAASLSGGVAWVAGKKGNALALDGVDGFASLPADFTKSLSDFTIAAWVRWDAAATYVRVFDFGSGVSQYMTLMARGGSGKAVFAISLNGGAGEELIEASSALPTGAWTHVAVTLSGGVGTMYFNGAVVGTNTAMTFAPFRLGPTPNNWLGRSQFSADPYFKGLLDDFRIYHNALSAAEIAGLAAS